MSREKIKIAVHGAKGKVGCHVVAAVNAAPDMVLISQLDVGDDLSASLKAHSVDVVIDFTKPEIRMQTVKTILDNQACAVVGTTGFTPEDLQQIEKWVEKSGHGVVIGPNFAVGSVLLMHFAREAARIFSAAEIVEYHHNQKADYPSGTAVKTAQMMEEAREAFNTDLGDRVANMEGARGAEHQGIHIHSVRLPGMIAHQEVLFGEMGQYLTLRHDAVSREAYMPGVLLAVRNVIKSPELVYGLESLMGISK